MERGLTIKYDDVAVFNMTFDLRNKVKLIDDQEKPVASSNLVTDLQMKIGRFRMISEIDSVSAVTYDILRTGVLIVTATHQLLHSVDVKRRHYFRVREITSD